MSAGDLKWMTAGSGILHQEMPKGDPQGRMHEFQLWANLPASLKMTDPRYQDIPLSTIPEVTEDDGMKARIICGEFWGKRGPVEGVAADPRALTFASRRTHASASRWTSRATLLLTSSPRAATSAILRNRSPS